MAGAITFDNFWDHNKNCRVRKVQNEVTKLAQDAKASGRGLEAELKHQGFRDFGAFTKTCKQFDLTCWPGELAELGSGFVLYFQFLAFLVAILVLVLFVQVPAMSVYLGEDWLNGWNGHKWQSGWTDNSAACNCLGSTSSQAVLDIGQGIDLQYGTSCKAWDADWCVAGDTSDKGKWCCTSWCFAGPECQAPEPEGSSSSLWNRHVYGMVRATSPCQQDATTTARCSQLLDKPYDYKGYEPAPANQYIEKMYATPGNLGPDQADQTWIPFIMFILVVTICYAVLFMYQHQLWADAKVDAGTTSPNDFAIIAKGLPGTATDEKDIAKFFEENAVKGRTDVEVVKVVIGWDVVEYQAKIAEIRTKRAQLKDLESDSAEYKDVQKQILQVMSDLASTAPDRAARLRSSGIVVVVFRKQADMRACLDRWESFWARWFNCDNEDVCWLPGGNGLWKGAALEKYPFGNPPVPVNRLQIVRASNPGDIHWEELGKDPQEVRMLFAKTNGIMMLLILASFGLMYGLTKAQAASSSESRFVQMLPGFGITLVNMVLMISARRLGDREYHETFTTQEFSQAVKMAGALMINTLAVPIFVNSQPGEWYKAGGLVSVMILILMMDSLIPPIFFLLDMKFQIGRFVRRKLKQNKIDSWNEVIRENTGGTKPEEAKRNQVKAEVEVFKKYFEPSEMDYPRRYANALNSFFCTLFLAPLFPLAPLIGIVGLCLQYCIDKYLLLRWYKRPTRPYNARLAQWSLRLVKYMAPMGFTLSFFFFLSPSWENKGKVLQPFLLALIPAGVMLVVPSALLRTLLGFKCCMSVESYQEDAGEEDYYQAQYMWDKKMKYHKDHFLYKNLSEAINPEFLKPGATAVKLDDIKGSYGDSTAESASADSTTEAAVPVKMSYGASKPEDGAPVAYGAAAPAPTSYGAGVAPTAYGAVAASADPSAPLRYDAEPTSEAPTPMPAPQAAAAAPVPHPPSAPAPKASVIWEYEGNHGNFVPFGDDCQEYVEKRFQDFQNGGKGKGKGKGKGNYINVTTGGTKVSIDFEKMTSKVQDSHKIRTVRRNETR